MLCTGLLLCLCACGDGSSTTPPSEAEAKSALASYVVAQQQSGCRGSVTLDRLSVTRVGSYERNVGGYPVFAAFSITCRHGNTTETMNINGSTAAATAYMRKSSFGAWEAYTPEILRQGQAQMDRQMDEMMKKLQVR